MLWNRFFFNQKFNSGARGFKGYCHQLNRENQCTNFDCSSVFPILYNLRVIFYYTAATFTSSNHGKVFEHGKQKKLVQQWMKCDRNRKGVDNEVRILIIFLYWNSESIELEHNSICSAQMFPSSIFMTYVRDIQSFLTRRFNWKVGHIALIHLYFLTAKNLELIKRYR